MFSILTQSTVQSHIQKNAICFGNKSSNLMELNDLCKRFKDDVIKIQVPHIAPIDDATIKKHLDKHAKSWRSLWNNFVDSHHGQTLSTLEKNQLKQLQTLIKECFREHPFPISSLKKLKKDDLLMVRSTGEEDTVEIANPGGNKSLAAIKNEEKSISDAIGVVIASYFSKKSITQRLLGGDFLKKESFMPVLIQKMVGEKLGGEEKENHIIISGVMYAKGPMTRIDVTPGHGEAIVNSRTQFDTFEVSEEGVVYPNIHAKPLRLIPTEEKTTIGKPGKRKLILHPNPLNLQKNPSLDPEIARKIADIGKKISTHYNMPMDIEFVYEPNTKTLNIVQARPIPQPNKNVKPCAILPEQWNKITTNKEIQKIPVSVIAHAGSVSKIVTDAKQIMAVDTIEIALKQCLENGYTKENIRAVFVAQPAIPTSHEAAQFNAMGIPVFKTDLHAITNIFNQKNPIFIADTQHHSIIDWTKQIKTPDSRENELLEAKIIGEGLFVSPTDASITTLPMKPLKNKKINDTIEKYIEQKNVTFNTKKVYSELNTCIDLLEGASFQHKNEAAFQALQKITTIFKKIYSSTNAKKSNSPHKNLFTYAIHSVAEIDLCLTKYSTSNKVTEKDSIQQYLLELVNKLKALIVNSGEEGLFSDSIKQIVARNKNDEIKLPQKIMAPQRKEYLVEFLKLNQLILHPRTREQWADFATYCSKYPTTRSLLAKYIKLGFQFNLQSELVNDCFPKSYISGTPDKTLATRFFNEIENNLREFKQIQLIENHQTIASFEKRIPEWSEPQKFEKLFKEFEQSLIPIIKSIDLKKSISNLSKQALLKQIQYLADVIDKSIKSLKGSQEYTKDQTTLLVKRFAKMLQPYHDLMVTCMEAIPKEQYDKWRSKICRDEEYNTKPEMISIISEIFNKTSKNEDSKQLNSSGEISIAACKVGTSASLYRQAVRKRSSITMEDLFSWFHQNILTSTAVLGKDCEIDFRQLPESLVLLINKIESNRDIQRISIQHNHPMLSIEYNIPLRNHSAKLNVEYDTRDGSFSLHHKYFGENWTNRMNVLAGISEIEGLFFKADQIGKASFNATNLLLEFGWKFKSTQMNNVLQHINEIINDYSQMTNDAHQGIDHDYLIENIQRRHTKETGLIRVILNEYKRKISSRTIDFNEFHDHFYKQILELASANNLTGIKDIADSISNKDLKKLLLHKDQYGNNALIWACYKGHNEVAAWLLSHDDENLQKEMKSKQGYNYLDNVNLNLYSSIDKLDFKQIKYIFQEYKNIPLQTKIDNDNTTESKLCAKFMEAVENQNLTTLKGFKDSVPDQLFQKLLTSQNVSGNIPLMIAIEKENNDMTHWLLDVDIDNTYLSASNHVGWKYEDCLKAKEIRTAIKHNEYEVLKAYEAKENKFHLFAAKEVGKHFLRLAEQGDSKTIERILKTKIVDNLLYYQDDSGNSALHYVGIHHHFGLMDYLISLDTDRSLKDLRNSKKQNYLDAIHDHLLEQIKNKNYTQFKSYFAKFPEMEKSEKIQKSFADNLIDYAIEGDLEKIDYLSKNLPTDLFKKLLLHKNETVHSTAIIWAASKGHTNIVNFILNQDNDGIQKNICGKNGDNYLKTLSFHLAILANEKNYKKIRSILDDVKEAYMMRYTNNTLIDQFKELVLNGDLSKIKELKDICSDTLLNECLYQEDSEGNNLLILSSHKKNEEMRNFLLELDTQNKLATKQNKNGHCFKDYELNEKLINLAKLKEYKTIKKIIEEHEAKHHSKFIFINDSLVTDSLHRIIENDTKNFIKNDNFASLKEVISFYPIEETLVPTLAENFILFARNNELSKLEEYARILPSNIFEESLILQNRTKDIPLTWAAYYGFTNIVNFLLSHDKDGRQKEIRNQDGRNYQDELQKRLNELVFASQYAAAKTLIDGFKDFNLNPIKEILHNHCLDHIKKNSLNKLKEIQILFPEIVLSIFKSLDDTGRNPINLAAEYGDRALYDFILSVDTDKSLLESKQYMPYTFDNYAFDKELSMYLARREYILVKDTLATAAKPITFIERKDNGKVFKQLMHEHIITLVRHDNFTSLKYILQIPEFYDFTIEKMGRRLIILAQHNKLDIIQQWERSIPSDIFQKLILHKNDNLDTAILWAAYEGSTAIMNTLLKYDKDGTQHTIRNKDGKNYLEELEGRVIKLAKEKSYTKIQAIISDIPETILKKITETLTFQGVAPDLFIELVRNNQLKELKLLTAHFSPTFLENLLKHQDKNGDSAILWSTYCGHNDITRWLLSIDAKQVQNSIKSNASYDYLDNISYYLITQLRKGEYKCVNTYLNEYKGIPTNKGFREPTNTLESILAKTFIIKIKSNLSELKDYISAIPEDLLHKIFTNKDNPVKKMPLEFARSKGIAYAKADLLKDFKDFIEAFPKAMTHSLLSSQDSAGKTALQYFTEKGNKDALDWISEKIRDLTPKSTLSSGFFGQTQGVQNDPGELQVKISV